ncbi:D-2-hydroxyacid dehydrogenase [Brevibacillus massiliensis]|jgi:phosphoglycerate dehydrogenase-like enzyme|uniref:D-2-hydroxyacid dehydrogenase n=1 Tax=Brevibacillus massiliensis TaxID=1118054 RepID=UPI000311728A|nr:D-2-hydroxyacid dehydrogenase [Brevibacillus massiliensis]
MIVSTTDELLPRHVQEIVEKTGEEPAVFASIEEIPQEIAKQTEILLTYGNDLTCDNIRLFENVKWIQLFSAGLEDLPLQDLHERQIRLTNAAGIHVRPMSEYVIMCMLHFEKDMHRYNALKRQKVYDRTKLVGELPGREVLIYGTGVIGQAVARSLSVFETKVYGVNTSGRPVEPFLQTFRIGDELDRLQTADYVISILPSTPLTSGLFSPERLDLLKPDAVFISIGRGDVVDEHYVAEMLATGRLKGAAFDVFQQEPLPESSPLWECDNLILTPHMSAKSIYYVDRCVEIFIENLLSYRKDKPMKNVVETLRGY